MLRKALWSGVLAGAGAGVTFVASRGAAALWRLTTREDPPRKR